MLFFAALTIDTILAILHLASMAIYITMSAARSLSRAGAVMVVVRVVVVVVVLFRAARPAGGALRASAAVTLSRGAGRCAALVRASRPAASTPV